MRSTLLRRVCACAAAATLLGGASSQQIASTAGTVGAGDATSEAVADAIRFRGEFGFPTAEPLVRDLIRGAGARDFGLPVSAEEEANLKDRAALRVRLRPAIAYVRTHASEFGGHYLEQSSGELVLVVRTLATTSEQTLAALQALLPADANVKYLVATYSAAHLAARRDELIDGRGVDGFLAAVADPTTNQVLVRVASGFESRARQQLERDRDAFRVQGNEGIEATTCVSRTNCNNPWRGGIRAFGDVATCTWGWNARPTTTASTSTRYVITAGHCATQGANIVHNSVVVNLAGGVDRNTFYFSGGSIASDSLRAPLKSQTGARNVIYINDVSMAYPITAVEHYQDQDVGDGVCMSGASSNPGYKCGTIKYIDFQQPVVGPAGQTKTVTHLWETSFSTVAGDSGAPVFGLTTDRAFGIATGRDTSEGSQLIYSSIDFVVNDMQVRLCLTAACS